MSKRVLIIFRLERLMYMEISISFGKHKYRKRFGEKERLNIYSSSYWVLIFQLTTVTISILYFLNNLH